MAAKDGIVVGKNNIVGGDVKDFALINCQGMVLDARDNGKTFINNSFVSTTNSTVGSASAPTFLTLVYGLYYMDCSGGDALFYLGDPSIFRNCRFTIEKTDSTVNKIIIQPFASELFNYRALPKSNLLTNQGHSITITSDGVNWFVVSSFGVPTFYTSETSSINTTSGVDILLGALTLTPNSGDYLIMFNTTTSNSNNNRTNTFSIYVGGVLRTDSVRMITMVNSSAVKSVLISCRVLNVLDGQAVEVRWKTSNNTATAFERTLVLTRI